MLISLATQGLDKLASYFVIHTSHIFAGYWDSEIVAPATLLKLLYIRFSNHAFKEPTKFLQFSFW